ncbi:MAG TPA: hypothetical protein VNX65_03335 [Patescibacteria group bacterium]|jgi:hypothetical protein|nr:hypothetical protein [Patescibacteria group bacterium]
MNKYNILILLNMPFVIFGLFKTYSLFANGSLSRLAYTIRTVFWLVVAVGILFVKPIYSFLVYQSLTDSPPPNLLDIAEITGIVLCVTVCFRLYSKLESAEKRLSDLHERLSIELSTRKLED